MKKYLSLLIVFVAFPVFLSGSLPGAGETLTLGQCLSIALDRNPLLQSSFDIYRASLARISQAKSFPQPSLEVDFDLQPRLFNFKKSGESYLGLSQTIEFPGRRRLRGKIASQESEEILADLELLKLDIAFQVKDAFFNLLLAQEMLKYARQDRELTRDFLEKAEFKHEAGDVALMEVMRARVEASKAVNVVKAAENGVRLAKARLNFLLARNKSEPLDVIGDFRKSPLALDLDELKERALNSRPEIKRTAFSMKKETFRKSEGLLSYFPDFNAAVSRHRISGELTTWDFTLSLPIPLFFWQPRKGVIAEAEANLSAYQKEYDHLRNAIRLEVEESYVNALTAGEQIRLFEDQLLSQAEEAYNMFFFSYQQGDIGGIELIEARRTLIEARKSYADSLCQYNLALAALEKSVGAEFKGDANE